MSDTASRTFESGKLHGLPVIAVVEGRVLGTVRELLFDPAEHQLLGVLVARRGGERHDDFLDISCIARLGPFAITARETRDLRPLSSHSRANDVAVAGIRPRGARVLMESGEPVGTVRQVWITPGGRVEKYVLGGGMLGIANRHEVAPGEVIVIGEDAMIVTAEAVGRAPDDAGTAASWTRTPAASHADGDGRDR